jgi:hypothetical protein
MFRNVSGQYIGVQMIDATTGGAFSGTVACAVVKDGGTSATAGGTVSAVGSSGFYRLACSQGDTDGGIVFFTFTGSGAIPVTVQVETMNKGVADVLQASANTMIYGTVTAGTSGTSFTVGSMISVGASFTPSADALAGRRVYFLGDTTTAALRGCSGRITANTGAASTVLTIDSNDTLTATPASGDTVVIL